MPNHSPHTKITDWKFISSKTGEVLEEIKMKEFFEWDPQANRYHMVRHYQLAWEDRILKGDWYDK